MPYRHRLAAVVGIVLVTFISGEAAAATGVLLFRNGVTGVAVAPDSVRVNGVERAAEVDAAGRLTTDWLPGDYDVVVAAAGFRTLAARHQIQADKAVDNVLRLTPLAQPAELLRTRNVLANGPQSATMAIVAGYVTDARGGEPLANAQVSISASGLQCVTDAGGFFSLPVSTQGGQAVPGAEGQATYILADIVVEAEGYASLKRRGVFVPAGDLVTLRLAMDSQQGSGSVTQTEVRGPLPALLLNKIAPDYGHAPPTGNATNAAPIGGQSVAQAAPTSIRVGMSCSCTSCSQVQTMDMETYTKHVLSHEWISSWNAESLKAGAIAVRSYGGYYAYHPISGSYDICNTSCCQVYGDTVYGSVSAAVDATAGIYVTDGAGNISRAEYAAENNNSPGCGNCYLDNAPGDGVCLNDSVCCGSSYNGHGRGMCQWGTQRWAANQGKDYGWICDHYYNAYGWSRRQLANPNANIGDFISETIPAAMRKGFSYNCSVTMKNSGPQIWACWPSGSMLTVGQFTGPAVCKLIPYPFFEIYTNPCVINPAENCTFPFTVSVPGDSPLGNYEISWQMKDNSEWFNTQGHNAIFRKTVYVHDNFSEFVSDTIPATMVRGQSYNCSVTMKNSGSQTWACWPSGSMLTVGQFTGPAVCKLIPYPYFEIYTNPCVVNPAENCMFPFTINVPADTPLGTYTISWEMKDNGVWFGQKFTKNVTVAIPAAPAISAAVSRKTHGGAGSFDIDVMAAGAVEPRNGGPTMLVVTFNKAIERVNNTLADVSLSSGAVGSLSVSGSQLTIAMTGAGTAPLTVNFPGIRPAGGGSTVTGKVCFGVLVGDVTGDRATNVFDMVAIRNLLNLAATAGNFRNDVTADGTINVFDLVAARNNLNTNVAACP